MDAKFKIPLSVLNTFLRLARAYAENRKKRPDHIHLEDENRRTQKQHEIYTDRAEIRGTAAAVAGYIDDCADTAEIIESVITWTSYRISEWDAKMLKDEERIAIIQSRLRGMLGYQIDFA